MKVGKPKSKRVSVRLRHKIEKASASKQRKARKEAKKNPQWRSRLKKDPGIPNLFPYKDKILAEIEESKRNKQEEQQRRRDVAKAQREGKQVEETAGELSAAEDDVDEDLMDPEDDELEVQEGDAMEEDTNPMAALLASAQARASAYKPGDEEGEEEEEDDEGEDGAFDENAKPSSSTPAQSIKKSLPKQALADPIRAVSILIERLEKTQQGMQQLLAYYQLPPLVTAGSDTTTRFLVDVARKRGRLGRGGIPNLHAAALTVLGDINDERLKLLALQQLPPHASSAATNKGEVRIVSQMAEPFRLEGLFGDSLQNEKSTTEREMEVET